MSVSQSVAQKDRETENWKSRRKQREKKLLGNLQQTATRVEKAKTKRMEKRAKEQREKESERGKESNPNPNNQKY